MIKFSQSGDCFRYGEMEAQFEKIRLKTGRKRWLKGKQMC